MSQGQGNQRCLFRRQSELWLAAHTQGTSSLVRLPCSRICLALKAGRLILLVYLEGLRVQGWWTHANLTRNRGLNQNVNLLFSSKSCAFSRVLWSANQGIAFLVCLSVGKPDYRGQLHRVQSPGRELEDNLHVCWPQTPCPVHHLDCREGSSACHESSPACAESAPHCQTVSFQTWVLKKKKTIFFLSFWLCCVCVAVRVFLWWRWAEAALHYAVRASLCRDVSCCGAQALGARASLAGARGLSSWGSWALEHRFSVCGTQA